MKRSLAVVLVVLAAACLGGVALTDNAAAQQSPDTTVITVSVDDDGNATWTIAYRYSLQTQEERDAFNNLQTDIQSNRSSLEETFRQRLLTSVTEAENETGRSMTLENATVTTSREQFPQQETGIVTYSVTWTDFAETEQTAEGRTLRIGDAINGFYVTENTRFALRAPDGYRLVEVTPSADSSTNEPARAVWEGPTSFTQNEPRLVATTIPADSGQGDASGISAGLLAAGIAVGVLLILVVLAILRPDIFPSRGGQNARSEEATAGSPSDDSGGDSGDDSGDDGGDDGDEDDGDEDDETSDPALMRNEERVIALLNENDGRMKQQTIVEKTGWSDAKTSNVVNDLQEEGKIDKFQLGRENVVSLPDVEVDPTDELKDK